MAPPVLLATVFDRRHAELGSVGRSLLPLLVLVSVAALLIWFWTGVEGGPAVDAAVAEAGADPASDTLSSLGEEASAPLDDVPSPASTPDLPPHCSAAQEKTGIEFVFVPGGTYTLGDEALRGASPTHSVLLSPFWIGKHPVTNEQFRRFAEETQRPEPECCPPERFLAPRQPVVETSWFDAMAYSEWAGLSLPTEAQWEAAARGTDQRRYPWGNAEPTPQLADFGKDFSSDNPDPVGSHPQGAGPFGAEDQAGGVLEWCLDAWDPDAYKGRDGARDPLRASPEDEDRSIAYRAQRGSSWNEPDGFLPSAFRRQSQADSSPRHSGFRVVCGSDHEP